MKDVVYDTLQKIRPMPELYLGWKNLTFLSHFLSGYMVRLYEAQPDYRCCLDGFSEFVTRKYNYGKDNTGNYARVILENTKNEEAALNTFFELLDEFLESNKSDDKAKKYSERLDEARIEEVYLFIDRIREKPETHIGENKSLVALCMLLRGYLRARHEINGSFRVPFDLGGFQQFVQLRFGAPTSSWDQLIFSHSASDSEAYDTFSMLFDEFRDVK